MIYYRDNELTIRNMEDADARIFTDEEIAQGWHADISKYETRLRDQAEGKCVSLTAEYNGSPAGYVNVYLAASGGAFEGKDFPEIVDFGVLEKYRRKGIGSKLMDVAEEIAGQYADTVCLGVGLHSGYGSAQRMYAKRGYIPDGTGVWYQDKPCPQYETEIENDDDLVLFLSRRIKRQGENQSNRSESGGGQKASEYNEDFWKALDELVNTSEIVIDRPKGSAHPRFPEFIYPVDYGYLRDTSSMDGGGIDVWVGSGEKTVDAVMCIVDLMKRDSEIKILIGCTEEEKAEVYKTHNETQYMKGVLIRR